MGLRIDQILEDKRQGRPLSKDQIEFFVEGMIQKDIAPTQVAAFCAFTMWKGMTDEETLALTFAMTNSGCRMNWERTEGDWIVDKHSTGGVGDKVSLILGPLWATLGARVPMVSARSAGHTGGTIDKLESICGIRTQFSEVELQELMEKVGLFIVGPNQRIAPADRILFSIRNETNTLASIPLIVSSVLSKKLAEGLTQLVLDVKFGCGAHMKTRTEAYKLAMSIESVALAAGLDTRVVLSDMNQPLGNAVGNGLEVEEAIRCLKGNGPQDLVDLVVELCGHPEAEKTLQSGQAYQKFEEMVVAQGGDLSKPFMDLCHGVVEVRADKSGIIQSCDAYKIGYANVLLGGGRLKSSEKIHHGVGIRLHKKKGDPIASNEVLAEVYICEQSEVEEVTNLIQSAYTVV